jgi:O-antigen ligase
MLIALGCALLGLAFLMPGHYVPWTSFEPQWVAGLGAVFIAAAALLPEYAPPQRRYRVPVLAWAAFALAGVAVLQWLSDLVWYRSDALLAAAYLGAFAAMLIVGRSLAAAPTARLLPTLMGGVLFGAGASAVIAFVQWLQIDPPSIYVLALSRGARAAGNLSQPNHLAALLSLGLAATLYFYETRRWGALVSAVCAALLGAALVLTESRAGWVMAGVLVVWWATQRRRAALRLPPTAVIVASLCFVGAAAALPTLNDALLLSAAPGAGARLHAGTRGIHWATLWDAAWRQPWFGYGWGQVSVAQVAAVLDHPASGEWVQNSHNLLLDLFIHNGIPIALAVVALLVWWFIRHVRACRTPVQWALLAGVGVLFTHEFVEFPLDYLYFLLPVGLMMGALEALRDGQTANETAGPAVPRALLSVVVAGLAAVLFWVGVEYMKVDAAARQLRFVLLGVGVDKVPDAPAPDVWLLDQPLEYHRFLNSTARPGMSAAELEWMRRASSRGARPGALMRYALALGLNGHPEQARMTLERICKMHATPRCDEGRAGWSAMQQQHDALRAIPYPPTPAELRQLTR